MSELKVSAETANKLYEEGNEYMRFRVLHILQKELEKHRKGSSGYATVESLIQKVSELPAND